MKISMWNLAEWLKDYHIKCFIKEGLNTIRTVRWLAGSRFESDVVYVCRDMASFGMRSTKNEAYIVHRYDMIHIETSDTDLIFNEIISAIDAFNAWDTELDRLANRKDGLQKMLESLKPLMPLPAFLYHITGKVLAITDHPADIHWHWKELVTEKQIPDDRFESLKREYDLSNVLKDRDPTYHDFAFDGITYWHCSLYVLNERIGHLVFFNSNSRFPLGVEFIMQRLIQAMQKHVSTYFYIYQPLRELAVEFTLWLDSGVSRLNESFLSLLEKLGWKADDEYTLAVIEETADAEHVLISRAYSKMHHHFDGNYVFLYHEQIVILLNRSVSGITDAQFRNEIHSLLFEDLRCVISTVFFDLSELKDYYDQVCSVLRYEDGVQKKILYAREYAEDIILQQVDAVPWLYCFASEHIMRLRHIDDVYHSDYYNTLKSYIKTGCQSSETAHRLSIHRNTLLYRLNRISELLNCDIFERTADPDFVDYLQISFFLVDRMLSRKQES